MSIDQNRHAAVIAVLAIAIFLTLSPSGGAIQFLTGGLQASADKGRDHDNRGDDDNSGKGSSDRDNDDGSNIEDDDRQGRINRLLAEPQALSGGATSTITIPVDAESHSAANPYTPNPATVSSGAAITWFNADDEDQHSATADDGSFSTGILNPGQSGRAVINADPGSVIPYHCDIHPEMIGILRVGAAIEGNAQTSNNSESDGLASSLMAVFDQPFAISRYSAVSEDTAGNITLVSVAGSMTTSLPNATDSITSNSNGNFTLAFTKAGAIQEGEIHLTTSDGMEEATITLTGFLPADNTIGIGIAMFAANPGGRLALIDNFVAITLYSSQPDNSTQIQFFDWQGGGRKDPANSQSLSDNIGGSNQTVTPPAANRNGEVISVSIVQGATGQGGKAFSPNAVQAKVGDTVIWTNDDTTPHTVTSGSEGQPNGKFDSSPNLSPLMASGKTFEHTFEDAGEYAYYCQLHPNMVGIVSVG